VAGLEAKNVDSPDETRMFAAHGHIDVVNVGGVAAMRGVFEPGWKWSVDVKPIAKTDSCQATHMGYVISGRMKVVMDDGTEAEAAPGDVVHIAPGHDAWIVGSESCVMIDFGANVGQYAKPS
jgi:mannose-6-phosphate isomerase-like protein (cupin superfamily)